MLCTLEEMGRIINQQHQHQHQHPVLKIWSGFGVLGTEKEDHKNKNGSVAVEVNRKENRLRVFQEMTSAPKEEVSF